LGFDENQQASSNDSLEVPIVLVTRSRAKNNKDAFNEFIQDIWVKASFKTSTQDEQTLFNVIYANKRDLYWV